MNNKLYLFGGWNGEEHLDSVIEVSPNASARFLPYRLPWARSNLTATSDGQSIYLFGGDDGKSSTDQILRFRPGEGIVRQCDRLPFPMTRAAASAIGPGEVLVFGGTGPGGLLRGILRYNDTACPTPAPMNLEFNHSACGKVVEFAATSDGTPPIQWVWDLGDGAVGRGQSVRHEYAAPGHYRVSLTANDDTGRTSTTLHAVEARAEACTTPETWPPTRTTPTVPPAATSDTPGTTHDTAPTTSQSARPMIGSETPTGSPRGSTPTLGNPGTTPPTTEPGRTPAPGLVALLGILGAAALATRRRAR